MLWKKSLHDRSPGITRSVAEPVNLDKPAIAAAARPQVAIFITHGMGQQVPFETLDAAAEGLARAATRKSGTPVTNIRACTVQIGTARTQRAEFDMRDANGKDVEVHVYEAYWAPFTEGQVNLRDTMWFLVRAGFNGLLNSGARFQRWMFGGIVSFDKQSSAALPLLAALGIVISLVVLNFVIAVAGADRVLNFLPHTTTVSDDTFRALTSITGSYLLASAIFGCVIGAQYYARRWIQAPSKSAVWRAVTKFSQGLLALWVILTIVTAGAALLLLVTNCIAPEPLNCDFLNRVWLLIWGALLIGSMYIRNLMVQFPGDVAAYVSSHTLDRFNDLRKKIKTTVFDLAKAVYTVPQYERIALLGHSLGSVAIYDTLNALINDDELNGRPLNVVGRTKLLLTFGSPLDKIAFIFATQWTDTTETREALAASLQPLILKYVPFRDIKWINVHAGRDPFCAQLDFFDDKNNPGHAGRIVNNVIDPDALIPVVAHVEYWQNDTLFNQLYDNL